METAYRYIAKTEGSYKQLATFVASFMDAQVTLYPYDKTIVIDY